MKATTKTLRWLIAGALATALVAPAMAQQDTAAVSVSSASADNTRMNQRDKSSETLKPTDQPNNAVDIKLAAAVRQAIVGDKTLSTSAHNVKLVAASGVVTLRGPVASDAEKARVSKLASDVSGVTQVHNELDIKQQ